MPAGFLFSAVVLVKNDPNIRSFSKLTLELDFSVMLSNDMLDNRKTETGAAAWTAAEQKVFGETQEKIDALKADNAALDESITAVEKEVETKLADEDTAYYNSVYEEMQKGVDQVEEYLKGN